MEILSVYEPDLCADDPTRKLMRQIMGAIAEYDKSMLVLKLRGARQRKKQRDGRCEGRKPYGSSDSEREILAEIRRLREEGMRLGEIQFALDSTGVTTRYGRQWTVPAISRVLRGR
jgi:DNA invertase Pin-like site-specific DNA recombinase